MPELNPDGLPVEVGGIAITTPGLRGRVEVLEPGAGGTRGAELVTNDLLAVLARHNVDQSLTVQISEHEELGDADGSRATGGPDDMVLETRDPGARFGQFVLYAAEDGSLSWHFPEERDAVSGTRGGATLTYRIPREIVGDGTDAIASRGLLGAVGKKLLKVLVFRFLDASVQWGANEFARAFELGHRPPRLRSLTPDTFASPTMESLDGAALRALSDRPALLYVHGTASSSNNAFGSIPPALFAHLYRQYGGRVFGFDHPTVSQTPLENVAWLGAQFAALGESRLDVDIVSHSRGGLVSRLLAEHPDLTGGRLKVDRLVMVASPNAGTALADPARLNQLLNRMTCLLQFVPDNGVTDVLDIVVSVVKQVSVSAFTGLAGLMSMNPQGEFLNAYLNRPAQFSTHYYAVASNFEPPAGSPLLRVARDASTDVVFGQAHNDLVVPTQGVYQVTGASSFPIDDRLIFTGADGVEHSTYWAQPRFGEALLDWLAPTTTRPP